MKKILFILLLLFATQAHAAANLTIWPLKVSLSPKDKTSSVHLINKGPKPVKIQVYAKSWDMDGNGKFIEVDTGDFVFFPRLTSIEPNEDKAIRVGYNGNFPPLEKPYRLYFVELPPIKKPTQPDKNVSFGIQAVLKLSVPLFVMPTDKSPRPQIEITATDNLQVSIYNHGTHNFLLTKGNVELFDNNGNSLFSKKIKVLQRVLPKRRLIIKVPIDDMPCNKAQAIEFKFNLGEQKAPDDEKIKRFSTQRCVPVM